MTTNSCYFLMIGKQINGRLYRKYGSCWIEGSGLLVKSPDIKKHQLAMYVFTFTHSNLEADENLP